MIKGPVYFNANGSRPDNIHDVKQYRISGGKYITRTSKMLNLSSIDTVSLDTVGYVTIGTNQSNFTFKISESNARIWKGNIMITLVPDGWFSTLNLDI